MDDLGRIELAIRGVTDAIAKLRQERAAIPSDPALDDIECVELAVRKTIIAMDDAARKLREEPLSPREFFVRLADELEKVQIEKRSRRAAILRGL
jgi:hypothetical protein